MAGKVTITKTTEITFPYGSTLEDLREFVAACEGIPGSAQVNVQHYAGGQRDPSYTTITVNGAP